MNDKDIVAIMAAIIYSARPDGYRADEDSLQMAGRIYKRAQSYTPELIPDDIDFNAVNS